MNAHITNRELLRNYKEVKKKLLSGEVEEIIIPQKGGVVLKLTVTRLDSPFEKLKKKLAEKSVGEMSRPDEDLF